MKKFNTKIELNNINNKSLTKSNSKITNVFMPLMIFTFCSLALLGITFSANIFNDEEDKVLVKITIINGKESLYINNVNKGKFSDKLESENEFESILCTSGYLDYDKVGKLVYNNNLTEDTICTIYFSGDNNFIDKKNLEKKKDNFGESYYYKNNSNNYIKVNNYLFRIVRINGDGTLRIMLNDNINFASYGLSSDYFNSNVRNVIVNWFNNNFNSKSYVVDSDFDNSIYGNHNDIDNFITESSMYFDKVGLLSIREAKLIGNIEGNIYLMNSYNDSSVWSIKNGNIVNVNISEKLGIRPVINIKNLIISGDGTINNPYRILEA